jgi:conjugal transfer ATP-binding protein TraC
LKVTTPRIRSQRASDLINLDTYTSADNLIFAKADGDKSFVGRAYVASPLMGGGTDFSNVIVNAIKSMPDDAVITVSLLCEPDYDAAMLFGKNKDRGGEVVSELIQQQQRLMGEALKIGWKEDLPALNKRRVVISAAVPITRISEEVSEEARQSHDEFLGNIKGCGFFDARALSASELIGEYRHFANIFRPSAAVQLDELVDIKYQVFGPDESLDFRDTRIGIINGEAYCAAVTCKAYPTKLNHGVMNLASGAPFNKGTTREGGGIRIPTPFILTTTIRVANQRSEQERVERAITSRQQQKALPIKLGQEDPQVKLKDLLTIKAQCATTDNKFVYASTVIFVYGKTPDEVIRSSSAVRGTLDQLGFDARPVIGNAVVRWVQTLPLNFSPKLAGTLECEAVMSAAAACCLLPVYGDYTGNASARSEFTGTGYFTRRGTAHYFDPFRSDSNYCGVVSAQSGSGKTVAVQNMITCELAQGSWVFAFDNGRSLKKSTYGLGGEYNEFGADGGFQPPSLNPFTGLSDDEFEEQQEGITSLFLMLGYDNEAPAAGARIATGEAVKAAWGQKGADATFGDVIAALQSIRDSGAQNMIKNEVVLAASNLIPRLTAFVESPSRGKYFRGKGTLNPKTKLTVFELGALNGDPHLKRCVLFFVLNVLLTRITSIRGRKMILVDEAHDILKDPGVEEVMEGIYLKCRKDKVSAWIIVQSLLKLIEMPAGRVMLDSSEWKVVLAQTPEEIDKVIDQGVISAFKADPYFGRLLRSVETRKGEFSEMLIFNSKCYEVVRLYVDRLTATLYSSEDEARDVVFDMMARGVGAMDAVRAVLGDTRKARGTWLRSIVEQLRTQDRLSTAEILEEFGEALE